MHHSVLDDHQAVVMTYHEELKPIKSDGPVSVSLRRRATRMEAVKGENHIFPVDTALKVSGSDWRGM